MKALGLYVRYALRSFLRGRSRSLFGTFCVAVGIASVVALGLVSGNFTNAATGDALKMTRGDLYASPAGWTFTRSQYRLFAALKARGEITDYTPRFQENTALRTTNTKGASTVGSLTAIDPAKFPFYDTVTADEPKGEPLRRLLAAPNSAVISHDALDTLHLHVGDPIVVNTERGFNHTYTITGVVPDNAPDPGFGAGFWNDFAMVDIRSTAPFFNGLNASAGTVYMKTTSAAQAARVREELKHDLGSLATVKTVADVSKDSRDQSDAMNKFFRVMGLVAVVIGGIGIINTMLVAARRRTREISVLKSIGMKGRHVVLVFTIEALFLALAGSVLGVLAGIGASLAVNKVTEGVAGYSIAWSLQAGPIGSGVAVGVVATVLFAYLPIVKASRARPVAALRSDGDTGGRGSSLRHVARTMWRHPFASTGRALRNAPMGAVRLPRRPGFRTALLTIVLACIMGRLAVGYTGLVGRDEANVAGIVAGLGALVVAGVLSQVFVTIVWLVSKLPSMGRLSVRMAFRSMGTQRRRLASTMLALCIGMLSVGSIAILAQNVKTYFSDGMPAQLHTNAIVQAPHNAAILRQVNAEVARLPGMDHVTTGLVSNSAQLVSIDGRNPEALLQRDIRKHPGDKQNAGQWTQDLRGLEGRQAGPYGYHFTILSGHGLTAADAGTSHVVLANDLVKALGATIGSDVVYADGSTRVHFTLVGTYNPQSFTVMAPAFADPAFMQQAGLATPAPGHLSLVYLDIAKSHLKPDMAALRANVHGVLVLDLGNFLTMIDKTLDKLALFPEIIAALSLFAGVIIIANTVALAMLERRREIGVMKAVGARRRTILQFLFVENAIVGFLGAGAGVGLAMLATFAVDSSFFNITATYSWPTVAGLLALGTALAIGASALTALPASSEKPMTVLRYE